MTWAFLWSFGRYDLRLTEPEFWALTPREFAYLADRAEIAIRWDDLRHALAPFIMASAYGGKKSKFKLDDFVISSMMGNAKREKPASANLLDKASAVFMSLGGKNS